MSLQTFQTKDGNPLPSIEAHLDDDAESRFVLWDDIQKIGNVHHLLQGENVCCFAVNQEYRLQVPLRINVDDDEVLTVILQDGANTEAMEPEIAGVRLALQVYKALSEALKEGDLLNFDREKAMEILANMDHHYSNIQTDLAILSASDALTITTRTEMKLTQDKLIQLRDHAHQEDAKVKIEYLLAKQYYLLENQPSRLFFVLPAGINTLEHLDPASLKLRLYFLCDCDSSDVVSVSSLPNHIHLSTHHGHDISRGAEFVQTLGNYVLTVLELILYGHESYDVNIGPVESMQILKGVDATVATKFPQFSKDHFPTLVKATVEFLRQHATRKLKVLPDPTDLHKLPSFLGQLEERKTALGRLYRVPNDGQYARWICAGHFEENFDGDRRAAFQDVVQELGGWMDKQQGIAEVELHSGDATEAFCSKFAKEMGVSEVHVVFRYQASRDDVQRLLDAVTLAQVSVLNVGGIPFETLPPNNSVFGRMASNQSLQVFSVDNNISDSPTTRTFLGSVYAFGGLYLTTRLSPIRSYVDKGNTWEQIMVATSDFLEKMDYEEDGDTWEDKTDNLVNIFDTLSDLGMSAIALYNGDIKFEGTVEFHEGRYQGLVEVRFPTKLALRSVVCAGFLRRIIVDEVEPHLEEQFGYILRSSSNLSQIKALIKERELLRQILFYLHHYDTRKTGPMEVVLFEAVGDHERVLTTFTLNQPSVPAGKHSSSIVHLPGMSSTGVQMMVKEWNVDYMSWVLQDDEAYILDKLTEQHPLVLTSFVLDTASLSAAGLASVANTLGRSQLWDLDIMCNPIDPSMTDSIQQIVAKVSWSALQSLILVGDKAEQWLWTLCTITEFKQLDVLYLQRFEIRSKEVSQSNLSQSNLSPSSFLWIHKLIEHCPMMELILQSVFLYEERNRLIIDEAFESSSKQRVDWKSTA
ncbi:hypothetical protein MVEG_02801 [Podila verticillata NRRL 6337]|nr:hypothetical protein MVEG_02801 [Podila verticillata NRRL 6337]